MDARGHFASQTGQTVVDRRQNSGLTIRGSPFQEEAEGSLGGS